MKPRPPRKRCTFSWTSADGKHKHQCRYLEVHDWPHECACGAQPKPREKK